MVFNTNNETLYTKFYIILKNQILRFYKTNIDFNPGVSCHHVLVEPDQ